MTPDVIVIHCAATPNGAAQWKIEDIDRWHGARGFLRRPANVARWRPALEHVGYHAVIEIPGVTRLGRAPDEPGAHAYGLNGSSLGICLVGTDAFLPTQWDCLAETVRRWQMDYGVDRVIGHYQTRHEASKPPERRKACPGFDVGAWLARGMLPLDGHVLDPVESLDTLGSVAGRDPEHEGSARG